MKRLVVAFVVLGSVALGTCAGCGGSVPRAEVADFVRKIEADEVNAQLLRGEWIELEGTLVERFVDKSNALLLDDQQGQASSPSGQRKPVIRPATAVLVGTREGKEYEIFCEFSAFGAEKLGRTSIGKRVVVRGILDSWTHTEHVLIPQLRDCTLH